MLTELNLIPGLGLGLSVMICAAIAARVLANALTEQGQMLSVVRCSSDLRRWADQGGYTILLHEAVRSGPFLQTARRQVVYRVVVKNQSQEVRQGWLRCGGPLKVIWDDRLSFAPPPSPSNDPLWDRELDA